MSLGPGSGNIGVGVITQRSPADKSAIPTVWSALAPKQRRQVNEQGMDTGDYRTGKIGWSPL